MPVQVDAYLDPLTGDLPEVNRLVTGMDLVAQRIRVRLQRGLQEWFLDTTVGLPLLEWRQQKPPQVQAILARLQEEIRLVPGVVSTANFSGTHEPLARRLTITGDVYVDEDSVLSVVVLGATGGGARNGMPFAIFFSSRNIQGGIPAPSIGRP